MWGAIWRISGLDSMPSLKEIFQSYYLLGVLMACGLIGALYVLCFLGDE